MPPKDPYKVPKKMQPKFSEITALTDAFCHEHLNAEYADMVRRMTAALARKRPSPLERGRAKTWACGVVYAVGRVNFLFDKSQPPHIRADELCAIFGVAKSTGGNKSKQIHDLLKINLLDPSWTLPSRMDSNPMAWTIIVNGLIVDARSMPYEVQVIAFEKGLIPYVPGDSQDG